VVKLNKIFLAGIWCKFLSSAQAYDRERPTVSDSLDSVLCSLDPFPVAAFLKVRQRKHLQQGRSANSQPPKNWVYLLTPDRASHWVFGFPGEEESLGEC
jgi:hypothetical protein